ncbi:MULTISPECIES: YceI family protein [unclassified Streptomyces]|uniref:YceI family protein n=1 Tax=unclassified Streptomyces TaxID=2593676 RepID=UPI002DD95BDF|nr:MULTISPECIES: YceI family protein [unclassified Streptomyces]WSA93750.1 YceI family protein [Streptomyces sp. NBC_01795]WSB78121.1 YceI family protein [Streptomyces sp. NBC_01775]WSS13627.1 YceI family protein [Streptomyces sp. NBC_01186]WSS42423.1 YceI family protein [Streptomyces sp. NBC_01187]
MTGGASGAAADGGAGAGSGGTGSGGVRARVRTRDGWAVQHAVLTVTDMTGTQMLRAEADEEGVVRGGEPLPPGAYTVIATAIGYAPAASTAMVTASGRADLGTLVLARQGGVELPPPGAWTIDPMHSTIAATAQHLGISSVHGRFNEFAGRIEIAQDPDKSAVEAVIKAESIATGNEMRDQHLRSGDFLNIETYPDITYRSTGVDTAGTDRWTVHGQLSMHGIVRDVDLDLSYLGTGPDPWGGLRAAFRATAELRRQDFAMNYNQVVAAGIAAVGTTLRVDLDIQAVQGETLPFT